MQPDYDDLDGLEEGGFNWMLVTVLLLAVAGFFSLAWYAYRTGTQHADGGDVVVIKADPSPVREKPEDAGGRTFAHQDKTIYEAISGDGDETVEIRLQPEAEEPDLSALETEEPVSADAKVAQMLQNAMRDVQEEANQAKQDEVEASPAPAPAPVKSEPKPAPVPAPVATESTPAPVGSGERVQLGAFRSNAEAEKHWQKVAKANGDLLGGKPHQVVRADLGDKGVFYRLRVAGFADAQAAKALCKALSARGQGCFVVQ